MLAALVLLAALTGDPTAPPICLPPGVPSPADMRLVEQQPAAVQDEHGRFYVLDTVLYTSPGSDYAFFYLGPERVLVIVDDHPHDPEALAWWYDAGRITEGATPVTGVPCTWRRRGTAHQ